MGLPLLNGVTAFSATTSIACAGLALTYSLPILLRVMFRATYLEAGRFTLGRCAATNSKCLPPQHLLESHICTACLALRVVFQSTNVVCETAGMLLAQAACQRQPVGIISAVRFEAAFSSGAEVLT